MGQRKADTTSTALSLGAVTLSPDICDTMDEAVLLAAEDGSVVAASSSACNLFRRTERELCDSGLAGLAGGGCALPDVDIWPLNPPAPFVHEATLVRGDGTTFSALIFGSPATRGDGTPLAHVIVRDLGEAGHLKAELEECQQRYESLLCERVVEMREAAACVREKTDEREQAEERFRALVEHSSDLILIVDAEARVTYCSPSVERLIGYRQDEVVGRIADEFIHGEDLALIAPLRSEPRAETALAVGKGKLRVRTKDGMLRWFGWAASNHLRDETIRGVVINARDITEHVAATRDLRASEERYRTLTETSPDMIYAVGADGRLQYVNGPGAQRFGVPAEQLIGLALTEMFSGATGARFRAAVDDVLVTGEAYETESLVAYPDGERWINTRLVALKDDEGRVTSVLGLSRDVTGRRRAQEALRESEQRYRSLFEDSPVALWEEDHSAVKVYLEEMMASGVDDIEAHLREHPHERTHCQSLIRTLDVNRAAVALAGASSRREMIEREKELYPPGCAGGLPSFWAAALAGQRTSTFDQIDVPFPDHTLRLMETYIVAPGHEETFDRVFIADIDVSERRRSEDLLQRYRLLFAEARDIMWFVRAEDGRIVEANAAAEAAYGYSRDELLALRLADMRADGQSPALIEQMHAAGAGGVLFEAEHRRRDGSVFPVEVSSRGIATQDGETLLLSVIRDVTARKQTEGELAQATARLERIVEAGVAALGMTAELRDPYTAGHQRRVAELACAIAGELGWDSERIAAVRTAALLHDLGKIMVPAEILSKPGKLTETEFSLIRQNAAAGAEILAGIDFGPDIATMVRQHHERLDGSGYPEGLRNNDILPEARVLAVADVVEAMVSHRPYRPALPLKAALGEIQDGSGRRYDADVCSACTRLARDVRFLLELPK
jgi:PAS domain S-box-containing protein/putative nucleotidyltransferase with HDIG domain